MTDQCERKIPVSNTPSPPKTPQRTVHEATLSRAKFSILRGEKIMILMRGLPGSGKSTLAKSIIAETTRADSASHIFSADDFFVRLGRGVYKYDGTRIGDAHSDNQNRVRTAARNGFSPIIVDNTNIETWEMRCYAAVAVENGYIVEILEPNTPWARNPKELAEKNTHNVPKSKIREKLQTYVSGVTGKKLLDLYGLKYSSNDTPPQMRLLPPITGECERETFSSCMADIKSNWDNHQKNNYVLTSHDIESMQNIDESHNSINDCSTLPEASSNSSASNNTNNPSDYAEGLFNDYLLELQNSDDESFELIEDSSCERQSDMETLIDNVDDTSDSQRSYEISKNVNEVTSDDCTKISKETSPNGSQQALGAIGSERKGSLAVNANIDNSEKSNDEIADNVLSQCWDFTLVLGRCTLHSSHGNYVSSFKASKITTEEKEEAEDGKVTTDVAEGTSLVTKESEMVEEQNVLLETEVIENDELISENVDNVLDEDDKTVMIDETPKIETLIEVINDNVEEEACKEEDLIIVNEDGEKNNAIKQAIHSDASCLHDCTDGIVKDLCELGIAITEEETKDNAEKLYDTVLLNSIFNMIKIIASPINHLHRETSMNDETESQTANNTNTIECSDVNENENDEEKNSANSKTMDLAKLDAGTTEEIVSTIDTIEEQDKIVVEKDEPSEVASTNPFREEIIRLNSEKENDDATNPVTDNINSISWKESPFPVDGAKIPVLPSLDDNKSILKTEASTNTTNYDFNVAYIGGTSEPEYRELWGVNRCINEPGTSVVARQERPPLKLMLDKSSMTNESNILAAETSVNIDKEKDSMNRLDGLIEMFPHYPVEYLKELYEKQCNCNFDWTVDVLLLADVPKDFTLENYQKKQQASIATNEGNATSGIDAVKLWKIENEKLKQRSHSSSPRNRRNRAKDFRSFSLEFVEDRQCSGVECSLGADDFNASKDSNKDNEDEDKIFDLFYAKAISDHNNPVENTDLPEASSSSTTSGKTSENIETEEEVIELNFGRDFINQLEKIFGNPEFNLPDEFVPVMRIKKSMAEELHGLWIQSMYHQMNALHAQLDERMAKDEAMARVMDREESALTNREPAVPNLEEIMNMEMALARYKNELKEAVERETPNDMASRLTRQMLYESLPDLDQQTLSEILNAHGGNFKETCEIIEASTGRTVSKMVTLKKQQSLLERVNEEQKNRCFQQNSDDAVIPTIVVNPKIHGNEKVDKNRCEDALARGQEARMEAQKQFSLRVENFNKAAEAYRKRYPDVAAYYLQMAKLHSENIKAAHADAADAFLSAQMYSTDEEDTLDLHNLYVPEAVQAMDVFLDYQIKKLAKSSKRSTILYVITGRGARSNNGLSKIKPAISKKLTSRNIRFTETNPGCLKVTLSKRNGMSD